MPVAKGEKKPQHTHEQKATIIKRVCALYESQNATLESCCEASGISYPTFYLWCAENEEFRDLYKKAKAAAADHFFENILVPKAMTATELLLMEREIEEEKEEELAYQGFRTDQKRKIVTKTKQQPNATTAIFVMKAAFPDKFKDRVEHSGDGKNPIQFQNISDADLDAALLILQNGGKK